MVRTEMPAIVSVQWGPETWHGQQWDSDVIIRLSNEERIKITFDEDKDVIISKSSGGVDVADEVAPAEAAITLMETITMVSRGVRSHEDAKKMYPHTWDGISHSPEGHGAFG